MMTTNELFLDRIEQTREGDSSGRDEIFSRIYHELVYDPSIIHLFFGRGANSTLGVSGSYAHNDWLETACNNGLLGVFILLFFFLSMYMQLRRSKTVLDANVYSAFAMVFFICSVKTLFSQSIQNLPIYQSIVISYCVCTTDKMKRINTKYGTF